MHIAFTVAIYPTPAKCITVQPSYMLFEVPHYILFFAGYLHLSLAYFFEPRFPCLLFQIPTSGPSIAFSTREGAKMEAKRQQRNKALKRLQINTNPISVVACTSPKYAAVNFPKILVNSRHHETQENIINSECEDKHIECPFQLITLNEQPIVGLLVFLASRGVISVAFGSPDTNTKVTCSSQKENTARQQNIEGV